MSDKILVYMDKEARPLCSSGFTYVSLALLRGTATETGDTNQSESSFPEHKKTDESFVPVTVRIEWLADGKIKPYLYWTPDGSCYEVKQIYETTPLALLKNRGEGLRFKVMSEVKDMEYLNYHTARHETYLYLADNFFCGKNIIDSRYNHEGKKFIPVTLDVFPNCKYELLSFKVHEQEYIVEKTIAVEPCGSYYAGGVGIRHKVNAINSCGGGTFLSNTTRIASLYFEINKWFVKTVPTDTFWKLLSAETV